MLNSLRIEAYVVVGDDDNLCDAQGVMPESLKNDAEWKFFQAGLDAADVCVLGRKSHEATPNHKGRKRLIFTRSVAFVERRDEGVFWNPSNEPLQTALDAFGGEVNHLSVVGGQAVFDFFLDGPHRYSRFHLSRVAGVLIPGGRAVFSSIESGVGTPAPPHAEDVLVQHGYAPQETIVLDEGVEVVSWG